MIVEKDPFSSFESKFFIFLTNIKQILRCATCKKVIYLTSDAFHPLDLFLFYQSVLFEKHQCNRPLLFQY